MGELKAVADGVWVVNERITSFGINLGVRMTILRLEDGGLWLHSPTPLDDDLAAAIEALGPVKHLVAPSCFHHMFIRKAAERWPEASVWVSPGLPKRIKKFDGMATIDDPPPSGWPSEVQPTLLDGMPKMGEVVFYHESSKTLVVTDLFMHVCGKQTFFSSLLYKAEGVHNNFAVPLLLKILTKDKKKLADSVARFIDKDIDRVIMAHGEYIDENASQVVRDALSYLPA